MSRPLLEDMRRGKFSLPRKLFNSDPELVKQIMGKCLIVRCEMLLHADEVEYYAISEMFDDAEDGDVVPEYRFIVIDGNITAEKI